MSLRAREELVERVRGRYQQSNQRGKHQILQEFVESTGYHRRYAMALLGGKETKAPLERKRRPHTKYNEEVRESLIFLWHAANEICAKRLIPFLPAFIESLERSGHWSASKETKAHLLTMSTATSDRLLRSERKKAGRGRSTTRSGKLLKKLIPIRTFADWNDVVPGFLEGDLVAHCGDNVHGAFLNTLTLTDIYSGWTECLALLQKSESEVSAALSQSRIQMPFPMLGLDTDNGSEFINYALFDYCKVENITFTRSRAYKKNDQAHVEEKNGSVVRRFIGYDRYEGIQARRALSALYAVTRLYVNFFQPSMKLISKERHGAKVTKKYDLAQTPYQRLMNSNLSEQIKCNLKSQFLSLDPVTLLGQIETLQNDFWQHAWKPAATAPQKVLAELMASKNSSAAEEPEQPIVKEQPMQQAPRWYRTTKKPRKPMPPRTHRTRKDAFEHVWAEVEVRLAADPCQSAKGLLQELQTKYPGTFNNNQLRTFQRRVNEWRQKMIHDVMTEASHQVQQRAIAA